MSGNTGNNGQQSPDIVTIDLTDLTGTAAPLGAVTPKAARVLDKASQEGRLTPLRHSSMQARAFALLVNAGLVSTPNVYLMVYVLDDSGSIRDAGAARDVVDATNAGIADMKENKGSSDVLVAVVTINGVVIRPWTRLEEISEIGYNEYDPSHGTPLYQGTVMAHQMVVAAAADLESKGFSARSITCVITDGHDTGGRISLSECRTVIEGLQESGRHIVGGLYRGDARESTFTDMGIPSAWIVGAGETGASLKNALRQFSRASSSASKSAKAFAEAQQAGVQVHTIG